MSAGEGSKRKAGGVIELPYLDGVQHAAFPEVAYETWCREQPPEET